MAVLVDLDIQTRVWIENNRFIIENMPEDRRRAAILQVAGQRNEIMTLQPPHEMPVLFEQTNVLALNIAQLELPRVRL